MDKSTELNGTIETSFGTVVSLAGAYIGQEVARQLKERGEGAAQVNLTFDIDYTDPDAGEVNVSWEGEQ